MHSIGRSLSDSHVRISYKHNPNEMEERFCVSLGGILLVIISISLFNWNEVRIKATKGSISSLFLI